MASPTENVAAAAADPEARLVWVIIVAAVAFLILIGRGFRSR